MNIKRWQVAVVLIFMLLELTFSAWVISRTFQCTNWKVIVVQNTTIQTYTEQTCPISSFP
jgi:hypothetical protein